MMGNKKVLLLLSIAFFIARINIHQTKAQSSIDYYKGLFQSWEIAVDTLPQEMSSSVSSPATKKDILVLIDKLTGVKEEEAEKKEIMRTISQDIFLLTLGSSENKEISLYKNIIVICDSDENAFLPQDLICNYNGANGINFTNLNLYEPSTLERILEVIEPTTIDDTKYYTIPEVLLITPEYQKRLGDYFKAISRAKSSKIAVDSTKDLKHTFKNIKSSSMLEITGYALAVLLIGAIFRHHLMIIVNNPKQITEKSFYSNALNRCASFLSENSNWILLIFIILGLFYIPIIYALSIKAKIVGDSYYAVKYLASTLNPLNIPNYITTQNLFRIGLLFYHYVLILFGIFVFTPNFISTLKVSTTKLINNRLESGFIKLALPTITILNGMFLVFFSIKTLAPLLFLNLVICGLVLLYVMSRKINYASLFSKKQRLLIFTILTAILGLNIFYPFYKTTKYKYEPLIVITDSTTMFPYSRKLPQNTIFDDFYYTGNSKILADGYLIYSSNTNKIINKSIKEFKPGDNFILVAGKSNEILQALLENPNMVSYLTTADFSTIFALDNTAPENFYLKKMKVRIDFNCGFKPGPKTIELEVLNLNKYTLGQDSLTGNEINPINVGSVEIMKFPGCKTDYGEESFEVPIDAHFLSNEFILLRLKGIDEKYLTSIKIFANEVELSANFINKNVLDEYRYKILYASPNFSFKKEIEVYSDIKDEFIIDIKDDNNIKGFNLSTSINELTKNNLLNNPFIIWSAVEDEIIKSE